MKKVFYTLKQITQTKVIPFTEEQLHDVLFNIKPTEIYHRQWNEQTPFIIITEYFRNSFMMYCTAWADKTPVQFDTEVLHAFLAVQGLEDCYIKLKV